MLINNRPKVLICITFLDLKHSELEMDSDNCCMSFEMTNKKLMLVRIRGGEPTCDVGEEFGFSFTR